MKKIIFALFALIIGIFLFIVAVEKVGVAVLLETIFSLSLLSIIVVLSVCLIIILVSVLRWREILKAHKLKYPFWKLVAASLGGFAISYVTPMSHLGGEPVRAYMLADTKGEKKKETSWAKIFSSIIVDKLIDTVSNFFILLAAVILLVVKYPLPSYLRTTILGILLGLVVIIWLVLNKKGVIASLFNLLSLDKMKGLNNSNSKLGETIKEIGGFFKLRNGHLYGAIFYSILKELFVLLRIWLILFFLGVYLGPIQLVLVTGLMFVSTIIPVPAAVGAFEVSQVFAFELLGYGANLGGAFSIILRSYEIFITFIGLMLFIIFGFKYFVGKLIGYSRRLGEKLNGGEDEE